jgi:hypothetical protein
VLCQLQLPKQDCCNVACGTLKKKLQTVSAKKCTWCQVGRSISNTNIHQYATITRKRTAQREENSPWPPAAARHHHDEQCLGKPQLEAGQNPIVPQVTAAK